MFNTGIVVSLRKARNRLRSRRLISEMPGDLLATQQDLVACYRIFLNREPDPAGLTNFSTLVNSGIPLRKLANILRDSTEGLLVKSRRESSRIERVDLPGFSLLIMPERNAISGEISATKNYEPHVTDHLREMIKPGMMFVDIGANIGFYAMLAASMGAEVEAIEPDSRNIWFLQKNSELNKFNINIHPIALADKERLVLFSPIGGSGQISELSDTVPAEEQQILKANSLDAVLAGKTPAIIKIDVEGAEGLVMRGAQKILDAKPIVFSELSAAAMNAGTVSAAEYISMLTKRGYSLFICQRDGTTNQVQATELERASLDNVHGFLDFMALPAAT